MENPNRERRESRQGKRDHARRGSGQRQENLGPSQERGRRSSGGGGSGRLGDHGKRGGAGAAAAGKRGGADTARGGTGRCAMGGVHGGDGRGRGGRRDGSRGNQRPDASKERDGEQGAGSRGRGGRGGGVAQRGRGGYGRGNGRDGTPEIRKLGYKTLEELLDRDASVVAITLSSSTRLQTLLEERIMRQDLVQLLCQVLCKAFQAKNDRSIVLHLAQGVKDSNFFQTVLPQYVTGIMTDRSPARREEYPLHLKNIITIMFDIVSRFPSSSVRSISMLVTLLNPVVNQLRASGVDISDKIDENLIKIQQLVDHLQEKARDGTLRSDNYDVLIGNDDAQPVDGAYKNMTIYPTPEEFHKDQKPILRPNIISQSYPSAHVYLDTHFRLLREDFVRPLRDGIRELLQNHEDMSLDGAHVRKKQYDDIRVYFDTQLVMPLCTATGMAYIVQFDSRPLKFVRWENSKRLLYGSLVCMSRDNFKTFLFATVSDRDPKMLKEGKVQLSFSSESRAKLLRVETSHTFVMVETTAYFEAYRYVLEGLQEQEADNLPFQRYIVHCNPDVHHPAYLLGISNAYDLSCIAANGQRDSMRLFNPLHPNAWPTEEQLGLDESQLTALKLALTKELVIIQGPPGTGKTHVGLKIAQALLENSKLWSNNTPMLVVCYTNHALDQFLEGIHRFLPKGIVRVGGRSNSEILKKFSLRELTRSQKFNKDLPAHLQRAYGEIWREMREKEQEIKDQSVLLECSLRGVMKEKFLHRYISPIHWDSLNTQPMLNDYVMSVRKKSSVIMEWLGLGMFTSVWIPQQSASGNADTNTLIDAEAEEMLEIDEEAALIEAERILVDAEPWEEDRRHRKMEERNLAELANAFLAMDLDEDEENPPQRQEQGPVQEQAEGGADNEGWEVQRHQKRNMKKMVKDQLRKKTVMSKAEESRIWNVWKLDIKDRWKLYRVWLQRYQNEIRAKTLQAEELYQGAAERLVEVRRREELCVLQDAKVIGMTTTGAAKYRQTLQLLRPRLVVVEEAAEVLEAHTIATLSQDCQHLILIGDHQQLRPSATVYDLAKNFNLDVSMFERLVSMDFPFVRLKYQHRMRPDIARLLTPHIYSELENHPSVLEYENVKGVLTNVYFLDHKFPEESIQDGRSHQNSQEAGFVVELCRYFLHQDYKPSQITVLTTYTGQLFCLRKLMPSKEFTGVKVCVVDKYQGEENDIVILSLVRSNPQGKVGFLQIANRVCVALSRAKKGLYCLGNTDMFSKVKLWSNILHTLREKDQVGPALALSCQNHPETKTLVSRALDFKEVPEGGCNKPCEFRLECGHVCIRMCHPYDPEHKKYVCNKACPKELCELGHKCPRQCHEVCGKCYVPVEKVIPQCQHNQMIPCHEEPKTFVCQVPCQKMLSCGHQCQNKCGDACDKCMVKVPVVLKCGHTQKEKCSIATDLFSKPRCRTKCGVILKCGHPCSGTCGECYEGRLHKACDKKCERPLTCSHLCRVPCTRECPPCTMSCENRCIHSKCTKNCGMPCVPCIEPCEWKCPHYSCTKLCHEPCDRPPCLEKCKKVLPCKHPCIGLCGDPCPKKCRVCDHDEVAEIFFGTEDDPDACFVQLEDCEHVFEATAMDKYISMDVNEGADLEQRAIRLKVCPKCRTPIRRNMRYGTHINRSLGEIEKVKEQISGLRTDIKEKQAVLLQLLKTKNNLKKNLPQEYRNILERLKASGLSLLDLRHQEYLMSFLDSLGELVKMQNEYLPFTVDNLLCSRTRDCIDFLINYSQRFSEQQISDAERECKRLSFLTDLKVRIHKAQNKALLDELSNVVKRATEILENTKPFTEFDELEVKEIFKELNSKLPSSGLGVTDEERVMIVKAMRMNLGHWFKCRNGHVYAIGDCGGAMVKSKCPECSATIGGENHTLTSDNTLATEMDGARNAAWSNATNLANYDIRNLD